MLNKFIYKILYKKREQHLNAEIKRLKDKVNTLTEALGDPADVVAKVLERKMSWYDYKALKTLEEQKGYVAMGDSVLSNSTFQNEVNHACADLINDIAKTSQSFEDVMNKRMILCGIKLLTDRLKDLGVDSVPTKKNLHAPL